MVCWAGDSAGVPLQATNQGLVHPRQRPYPSSTGEQPVTSQPIPPPTQRRVYELFQLDIRVTPDRTLDIHGSFPTDRPLISDSEVSAEVPRDPYQNHPVLAVAFELIVRP